MASAGTVVVVTVSDSASRGQRKDTAGDAAVELLEGAGFEVAGRQTVPDEQNEIESTLRQLAREAVDLVITTGGTGLGPRDVTPEATRSVIQRDAPGLAELMRAEGLKATPMAALSRGVAGARADTLFVNLPGSEKAVRESLGAVLPVLGHAVQLLRGDTDHR